MDESPLIFTARHYAGSSYPPWCSVLGVPGLRPHTPQGGLLQPRYPSSFSATTPGRRGQPSPHLLPSYQSLCSFFYESLGILLFGCPSVGHSCWLKFSCKSSLALGEGVCGFHLLRSHLGASLGFLLPATDFYSGHTLGLKIIIKPRDIKHNLHE